MPKEGHDEERFDINGVHFAYSDFILTAAGYHNAASLGGVIVPNNYYRLTYYTLHDDIDSNRILKIDFKYRCDRGQFIAIEDATMTNIIYKLRKYINNIIL